MAPLTISPIRRCSTRSTSLFRRALARDDRHALLLPELIWTDRRPSSRSRPREPSARGPANALIVFVKRRILLPLTRWLFEYALENFRVQDRVNLALMSCLQSLAADHVRLRRGWTRLEAAPAASRSTRRPLRLDEARLRRPSLRSARHRRIRSALPCARPPSGAPTRRHRSHELRDRLRHLGQRAAPGRSSDGGGHGGTLSGRSPASPESLPRAERASSSPSARLRTRKTTWFTENGPRVRAPRASRAARPRLRPRALLVVPLLSRRGSDCRWSPIGPSSLPTAEDDDAHPHVDAGRVISSRAPGALLYLTPEEQALVDRRPNGRRRRRRSSVRASIRPCPPGARIVDRCLGRHGSLSPLSRTRRSQQGLRSALRAPPTVSRRSAAGRSASPLPLVLAGPILLPVPSPPKCARSAKSQRPRATTLLVARTRARDAVAVREPEPGRPRSLESWDAGHRERPMPPASRTGHCAPTAASTTTCPASSSKPSA